MFASKVEICGRSIGLKSNSVVCLVGANSVGKSSILQAIEKEAIGAKIGVAPISSLGDIEFSVRETDIQGERRFHEQAIKTADGSNYQWEGGNFPINGDVGQQVKHLFQKKKRHDFFRLYLSRIDAARRLNHANPVQFDRLQNAPTSPAARCYVDPDLEKKVSNASVSLFGKPVLLNPSLGSKLGFHFGDRPENLHKFQNRSAEYGNVLMKMPLLSQTGDGVKAAMGLVLEILTSTKTLMLVDEPDLYLHPPQAHDLARLIAKEKKDEQFFFATHSSRFVQGLIEEAPERLVLLRLRTEGNNRSVEVATPDKFLELKSDPVIKYSSVSDGLFHKHQILCENQTDCLVYQHALGAIYKKNLDQLGQWIGVNGVTNFPKVVSASKALSLKPICIADFDIFREDDNFQNALLPTVAALGGEVQKIENMLKNSLFPQVNNTKGLDWKLLKLQGLGVLAPYAQIYNGFKTLIAELSELGLIVLECGELESLHEPRLEVPKSAVANEIVALDVATDARLENLRVLIKNIQLKLT